MLGRLLCRLGRHRMQAGIVQAPGEHALVARCERCSLLKIARVYHCQFPLRRQ